jgi:hypothetical protein
MFNKNRTHLKLCQLVLIFRIIEQIKIKHKVTQVFFCGDFNLIPNSSLYEFIVNQNINFDATLKEFSNQSLGFFDELEGNEQLLLSLNDKYIPMTNKSKNIVRNFELFEDIVTIVPLFDIFSEEIVFCNIESFSLNILIHCFNTFYGGSITNNAYYLKKSKKQKHVSQRKKVLTHIMNSLSKQMNFKSSYSFVKSKEKYNFSNNDVLVTQVGEDIKGIFLIHSSCGLYIFPK